MGLALKGKSLLLGEQILSSKSWPLLRRDAEMKIEELCKPTHLKASKVDPCLGGRQK